MQTTNEDAINQWRDVLKRSAQGNKMVVAQKAVEYQQRGFTSEEAVELLIASGADAQLARSSVAGVYLEPDANANSAEAFDAARVASANPRKVAVLPTKYSDVIPVIETALFHIYTPRQFVNRIARSNQPIAAVNNKTLDLLYRLAEAAQTDDSALSQLHQVLEPFVENAILDSVLIAEQPQNRVAVASSRGSSHLVSSSRGNSEVDLAAGTCDCGRFQQGNFGDFGVPCEHIVRAAMTVSPHERLVRALHTPIA